MGAKNDVQEQYEKIIKQNDSNKTVMAIAVDNDDKRTVAYTVGENETYSDIRNKNNANKKSIPISKVSNIFPDTRQSSTQKVLPAERGEVYNNQNLFGVQSDTYDEGRNLVYPQTLVAKNPVFLSSRMDV